MRTGALLKRALAHPAVIGFAFLLALLVSLPSLDRGWEADDLVHRDMLVGPEALGSAGAAASGLFAFLDPERVVEGKREGLLPWWTHEELRISFFRPLTAFTHWLDYRLWPDSPARMHAQSFFWYGLACALAALFYRRTMGEVWPAGLAALFFVLDDAHTIPITWIANRNASIALVFAIPAILAHDRWRRAEGGAWMACTAVLFFVLSLLSAEAGLATAAYVVAHALTLDRGSAKQRLLCVLPYALVVIAWRLSYQSLGHGTFGSDLYVDPGREPLRFLPLLTERLPIMLSGQLAGPNPVLYSFMDPEHVRLFALASLALVGLLTLFFLPLLRSDPMARFYGLGALLALAPFAATNMLSGRLLFFSGLGGMALVARFICGLIDGADWFPRRLPLKILSWIAALALLLLHAGLSPYTLIRRTSEGPSFQRWVEQLAFPEALDRERGTLVVVNPPSPFFFVYARELSRAQGRSMPDRLRFLAPGYRPMELTRIDERTLDVTVFHSLHGSDNSVRPPTDNAYFYQNLDRTFRSTEFPLPTDRSIEVEGMSVSIGAISDDGVPSTLRFSFTEMIEGPDFEWLLWNWEARAYESFQLPAIGESLALRGPF